MNIVGLLNLMLLIKATFSFPKTKSLRFKKINNVGQGIVIGFSKEDKTTSTEKQQQTIHGDKEAKQNFKPRVHTVLQPQMVVKGSRKNILVTLNGHPVASHKSSSTALSDFQSQNRGTLETTNSRNHIHLNININKHGMSVYPTAAPIGVASFPAPLTGILNIGQQMGFPVAGNVLTGLPNNNLAVTLGNNGQIPLLGNQILQGEAVFPTVPPNLFNAPIYQGADPNAVLNAAQQLLAQNAIKKPCCVQQQPCNQQCYQCAPQGNKCQFICGQGCQPNTLGAGNQQHCNQQCYQCGPQGKPCKFVCGQGCQPTMSGAYCPNDVDEYSYDTTECCKSVPCNDVSPTLPVTKPTPPATAVQNPAISNQQPGLPAPGNPQIPNIGAASPITNGQNTVPLQNTGTGQNTVPLQNTGAGQNTVPVQNTVPLQNTAVGQNTVPLQNSGVGNLPLATTNVQSTGALSAQPINNVVQANVPQQNTATAGGIAAQPAIAAVGQSNTGINPIGQVTVPQQNTSPAVVPLPAGNSLQNAAVAASPQNTGIYILPVPVAGVPPQSNTLNNPFPAGTPNQPNPQASIPLFSGSANAPCSANVNQNAIDSLSNEFATAFAGALKAEREKQQLGTNNQMDTSASQKKKRKTHHTYTYHSSDQDEMTKPYMDENNADLSKVDKTVEPKSDLIKKKDECFHFKGHEKIRLKMFLQDLVHLNPLKLKNNARVSSNRGHKAAPTHKRLKTSQMKIVQVKSKLVPVENDKASKKHDVKLYKKLKARAFPKHLKHLKQN